MLQYNYKMVIIMKKKNGFTLVEILITIVIIGLILLIVIPTVNNLNQKALEKSKQIFYSNIKSAALSYADEFANDIKWKIDSKDGIEEANEYICIPVKFLKEKGFFKDTLQIPGENQELGGLVRIERDKVTKVIDESTVDPHNYDCQVADSKKPEINLVVKDEVGNTLDINNMSWTNKTIILAISASDENGINSIKIKYNSEQEIPYYQDKVQITIDDNINKTLNIYATDNYGNISENISFPIMIDKIKPICNIEVSGTKSELDSSWYITSPTITMKYQDEGSVKSEVKDYGLNNTNNVTYNSSNTISGITNTNGTDYYGYVKDNAGNENSCKINLKVDTTIPTSPQITGGSDSWQSSDLTISVSTPSISEYNPISYYEYCLSSTNTSESCTSYTKISKDSIVFTEEQDNYIFIRAVNSLGVKSTPSNYQRIRIDKTTPTLSLSGISSSFTKGTSKNLPTDVTYGISGGSTTCKYNSTTITNTSSIPTGSYTITCTATGNNGLTTTISKSVTVTNPCECSSDSDCGYNYSCDGRSCYYDPQCECSSSSQCSTNYSCDGCSCYYDPPASCVGYHEACTSTSECCGSYRCSTSRGICVSSSSSGDDSTSCSCISSSTCPSGQVCYNGSCCTKEGSIYSCCQ